MSNAAREAVIQEYCRELKLAAVIRDYPGLCRRARDGGAYEELLRELLEAEITNRHIKAPRAACCARRAFPIARPSTNSTGPRSRAYH
jgi:hypothetical protein